MLYLLDEFIVLYGPVAADIFLSISVNIFYATVCLTVIGIWLPFKVVLDG